MISPTLKALKEFGTNALHALRGQGNQATGLDRMSGHAGGSETHVGYSTAGKFNLSAWQNVNRTGTWPESLHWSRPCEVSRWLPCEHRPQGYGPTKPNTGQPVKAQTRQCRWNSCSGSNPDALNLFVTIGVESRHAIKLDGQWATDSGHEHPRSVLVAAPSGGCAGALSEV
jgi:hypothetical protein